MQVLVLHIMLIIYIGAMLALVSHKISGLHPLHIDAVCGLFLAPVQRAYTSPTAFCTSNIQIPIKFLWPRISHSRDQGSIL